jgi:hypothetical protein
MGEEARSGHCLEEGTIRELRFKVEPLYKFLKCVSEAKLEPRVATQATDKCRLRLLSKGSAKCRQNV